MGQLIIKDGEIEIDFVQSQEFVETFGEGTDVSELYQASTLLKLSKGSRAIFDLRRENLRTDEELFIMTRGYPRGITLFKAWKKEGSKGFDPIYKSEGRANDAWSTKQLDLAIEQRMHTLSTSCHDEFFFCQRDK